MITLPSERLGACCRGAKQPAHRASQQPLEPASQAGHWDRLAYGPALIPFMEFHVTHTLHSNGAQLAELNAVRPQAADTAVWCES